MKFGSTLASASILAIAAVAGAAPAFAQEAPADNSEIGEIVVTAQRRAEKIQDVPIAITAFSPERLSQQNIVTAQNLDGVVPSLRVGSNGQATRDVESFNLRGVGATYQGASAVVVYLAEVPLAQAFSTNQQGGHGNYADLESVQVLAGPQGTLFGRNTTGGAVLLVPRKPANELEGYVKGSYGNYDYQAVEGVLNVPLVDDKLLVRVSGTYQDRRGFTKDVNWDKFRDDMHYYAGRIGITFKPSEKIENYLLVFGSKSKNNGSTYKHQKFNTGLLAAYGVCGRVGTSPCSAYTAVDQDSAQLGPRKVRLGLDVFDRTKTWGGINKTSIDLGGGLTLNNIVSYQHFRKDYRTDEDGTLLQFGDLGSGPYGPGYFNSLPAAPRDDQRQYTEELQILGRVLDDKLDFAVGAFYFDQKPTGVQQSNALFFCPIEYTGYCTFTQQTYSVSQKSKALYAQTTLDLGALTPALDRLRLTGGYRRTWDTIDGKSTYWKQTGANTVDCVALGTTAATSSACTLSAKLKSEAPTWNIGFDYKPVDRLMLFGKVNRGYKAGTYNPFSVRPTTRVVMPEFLTSYEGGFKSDFTLGEVPIRLNGTAYLSDYKNIQLSTGDFNNGASGARPIQGTAKIKGFEVEATIRPASWLDIGANVSHIDARLTKCGANCSPIPAPRWSYGVNASVNLPVPETIGKLNFYANYSHVSSTPTSFTEPGGILESYGLLNLSLSLREIAQSPFDVELFMTNATNKLYRIGNANLYNCCAFQSTMYGEPRMFGMRVKYNFGQN